MILTIIKQIEVYKCKTQEIANFFTGSSLFTFVQ